MIQWNGASYPSLAKFTAATALEAGGIQGPAGFVDPAIGDLMLKAGSPAIGPSASPSCVGCWDNEGLFGMPSANPGQTLGAYAWHNGGFEADTAGWSTGGSSPGVTLTWVTGGHTGSGAAMLTNTATTPATCTLNDSPNVVHNTMAGTYTATLWVRADTPGATLTLKLREYVGSAAVAQATNTVKLTSQWQPVTVQYTAAQPGGVQGPNGVQPSTLDFNAYVSKAPPGTCFYADDASVFVG